MRFSPANALNSYVPTDVILPEKPEDLRRVLNDTLNRIIDALNDKDIAQYDLRELVNGQKWFTPGDTQRFRVPFRKVIDFGALPNSGPKGVAHGITTNSNTTFTRIYAVATDPGIASVTSAIPIPYVDPNALSNSIEIAVDATNVVITTAFNYTSYTTCYVVLEYLQY